ncbi:MAG: hypothetical protein MO853_08870 [Candidatus Protistobacter heckmanni]|nr:hypothetical protein [Candidatus Protistobacter heckmanni]
MWYTGGVEDLKKYPGLVCRQGKYYSRLRVPAELVAKVGRHEFKESLDTKGLNTAVVKHLAKMLEFFIRQLNVELIE